MNRYIVDGIRKDNGKIIRGELWVYIKSEDNEYPIEVLADQLRLVEPQQKINQWTKYTRK